MPLPLIDEVEPVVAGGSALGLDVLAAGSPVMDPRPLGLPCAKATEWPLSRTLKIIAVSWSWSSLEKNQSFPSEKVPKPSGRPKAAGLAQKGQKAFNAVLKIRLPGH